MSSLMMINGGAGVNQLLIADEARDDLWNPRFNYNYQQRGKEFAGVQGNWVQLWPRPRCLSGDPSVPLMPFGQDGSDGGRYEYPSTISRGINRPWFFRGVCKNAVGNPLGGAVISAFLTATNTWVSTVACNDRGEYECPTPFYATNHYLVARYASGNLAGATIDTLQPVL